MGPTITPMPQSAIAEPCFSRGLMSRITAWDSGTSGAPNAPWRIRNATICSSEVAMPQSIDAIVKPITAPMNRDLRPKRSASGPVSGVMIAADTMYDVSTHEI